VRNTGTDPIVVHISLHDWWRTPEGKFQILPAGSLERSCAPWLVYSATTLELAPGEEAQVSVQVTVPEDVEGDHWALLLVAEEPQPVEEQQAEEGLTSTTRVVVTYAVKILQQDPVNAAPAAEIRGIELVSQDPLTLQVHYANTGNCHITGQGTVELRDIFGETVRSYTVVPFPLLPGEERERDHRVTAHRLPEDVPELHRALAGDVAVAGVGVVDLQGKGILAHQLDAPDLGGGGGVHRVLLQDLHRVGHHHPGGAGEAFLGLLLLHRLGLLGHQEQGPVIPLHIFGYGHLDRDLGLLPRGQLQGGGGIHEPRGAGTFQGAGRQDLELALRGAPPVVQGDVDHDGVSAGVPHQERPGPLLAVKVVTDDPKPMP